MQSRSNEKEFLARFFLSFAVVFFIVLYLPLGPLLGAIAGAEAAFLNAAGIPALASGNSIVTGNAEFEIVNECSSLLMIGMLACLLFASRERNPFPKLAAGAVALFAFNLLRLALTIAAGALYGPGVLSAVHFSLWMLDAALVVLLWAALTSRLHAARQLVHL